MVDQLENLELDRKEVLRELEELIICTTCEVELAKVNNSSLEFNWADLSMTTGIMTSKHV